METLKLCGKIIKADHRIRRNVRAVLLTALFLGMTTLVFGQKEFDKKNRDQTYKKGTNIEYYKNGKIKSISKYRRKVFWYYTDTYWTIKEYDMEGNQIRLIKKVTQMARRENVEKVVKEEIYIIDPKKTKEKENIRPE